ncbi:hypothetical protein ACHAXR_009548 [Thalassiosira sp. AJA248-18]
MKLLSAVSTLLLLKGAASQDCPTDYTAATILGDGTATLYHAIVDGSILCARIESNTEGYIGLGISPAGTMAGGEAIIGSPDEGTVQKYQLGTGPRIAKMSDEKQTLMHTSITQSDGETIMEFAKLLKEDGEHEILANGENIFVYALGGNNQVIYHGPDNRGSFPLDFETLSTPTSSTTTLAPTFGGSATSPGVSIGLTRTMSPTGGVARGTPSPIETPSTPTPPAPTPTPTPPDPTPPTYGDSPSNAMATRTIGTMILGAGAIAVWFGM